MEKRGFDYLLTNKAQSEKGEGNCFADCREGEGDDWHAYCRTFITFPDQPAYLIMSRGSSVIDLIFLLCFIIPFFFILFHHRNSNYFDNGATLKGANLAGVAWPNSKGDKVPDIMLPKPE